MGDESASLDLFLVIEQTCFKSSHLEFPAVPRAVIIPPRAAGKQEVARWFGFFSFFFPQPWRLIDSCLTPQPPPPPTTTTTTTTPTYAISFRTPLWLAGPPRNESPARSPRRDIAQNEWGLRSYFQGKPVRSRLTSPPTPPPPPSHQEPPLFLSCWQMKDHFRACSCPMEPCLPSALFLLLRERWGGGPILLPWEGGPRKEHSAFVAFSFFFVLFFFWSQ